MNILDSIILGFIEGLTEFLPISSTGHLILTSHLLGLETSNFLKSFEISIQFGAILAVVAIYYKKILADLDIIKKIAIAFIPTGILGFLFYKLAKSLLGNSQVVLWSLFLGGIIIILFELIHREKPQSVKDIKSLSYKQSLFIGTAQAISIIPGVSRSAATIIGGLLAGVSRTTIVEFSFLLAVPTMAVATAYDLLKNAGSFSSDNLWLLAIGFIVSFFVAIAAIKLFLSYIKNHSFIIFGVYRIILALIFWYTLA